jgi:transcriptional regulator with XRE-family HTH domain
VKVGLAVCSAMATRERPVDRGSRIAARALTRVGEEIRSARHQAGLSQAVLARAVGVHRSTIGRIECGEIPGVSMDLLARLCAVVGLDLSVRAYPRGEPVRDAAHVALLGRLRSRLPADLPWRTEVPFPIPGDLRAWDAVVGVPGGAIAVGAETRLSDTQALARRLAQKRRDGGVERVILLVGGTASNRRALALVREALRVDYPLDTREILAALATRRPPAGCGIVVL